jgi:putative alpha-1,2-mannosidase
LEGEIRFVDSKTIEVLRRSEAWARNQYVYARIEFNTPLFINSKKGKNKPENLLTGEEVAISLSKQVKKGEKILVKVSLSPTSYEGAKLNSSEIKHWDFDKVIKTQNRTLEQRIIKN